MKGYEIPEFSRTSKGLPVVNLLPLEKDEKISAVVKLENKNDYKYLLFGTKNGIVKRTLISEFDNIRTNGKIAISLRDNDELNSVKKTHGDDTILMCSSMGRMVRFNENDIRVMGRTASGVKGITLTDDICVGTEIATDDLNILVVTEKGYGKKTPLSEYRETKRGSKGVKTINISDKNGKIVGFKSVEENKDLMIITNNGIIIRLDINNISQMGRVTKGVKLINIKDNNAVASISIVNQNSEDEIENVNDEKE